METKKLYLLRKIASLHYLPRWVVFALDICITFLSFLIVYFVCLRPFAQSFGGSFSLNLETVGFFPDVWIVLVVQCISFFLFKTYAGILRYSAYVDLFKLFLSVFFTMGGLFLIHILCNEIDALPPTFLTVEILLFSLLNLVMLFSLRLFVKTFFEQIKLENGVLLRTENIMIYGAGKGGVAIAKSLKAEHSNYQIVGFIDETADNHLQLLGAKVYSLSNALKIITKKNVKKIIVSPLKMQSPNIVEVIDIFLEKGITILTTSNFSEYNAETTSVDVKSIQKIEIQDLLERKEISIDKSEISKDLYEKVVLITGSAGSIGSEIARQVCSFNPKLLIVLDQSETALFEIKNEIKQLFPKVNFLPFLGNVRDRARMEYVISEYKPDVIYHAAAYKHVPMLEDNPVEAIQTNVLGTKNMADLAVKHKVKKFVMISTDKAVNPANIMGASKRIAEIYVQSYFRKISKSEDNTTNFITTRFGNVLGSNGSVIPIFKRQIEEGGPVKVTHPEIIRYFMTIPEACNLVLEAGTLGKGGEIFIFDMGTPVKIDDLAKKMIRLAGFTPNVDIMIEYTGLRPGEKLYEELLNMKEITKETSHKKIMIATVQEYDYDVVSKQIDELIQLSFSFKDFLIVQKMKQIVPEFKSKNSLYESLDK